MNEILCAVVPRKFSEASAVTFGKVPKCDPCSSIVRMTMRRRIARRSNKPANASTLSLAIVKLLLVAKGKRFVQGNTQNSIGAFEFVSGGAEKLVHLLRKAKRNQSSRTVRERWAARLARTSPTHIPL